MAGKLNIILDLDNTLIESFLDSESGNLLTDSNLEYKEIKIDKLSFKVYKRPYLDVFLNYLFSNFNVSIYTAAEKEYALQIVWNFIQNVEGRKVDFILHRTDLINSASYFTGYKDLRYIWEHLKVYDYYPCNTILIDDNPKVYQDNQYNVINVPQFKLIEQINNSDGDLISVKYNKLFEEDNVLLNLIETLNYINEIYHSKPCTLSQKMTRCNDINENIFKFGIPSKIKQNNQRFLIINE